MLTARRMMVHLQLRAPSRRILSTQSLWLLSANLKVKQPKVHMNVELFYVPMSFPFSNQYVRMPGISKQWSDPPTLFMGLPSKKIAQAPMNEALAYMNMPPEPLLEEPESDDCKAPAAKRPRKAHVVEEALNQGNMQVVPHQTVLCPTLKISKDLFCMFESLKLLFHIIYVRSPFQTFFPLSFIYSHSAPPLRWKKRKMSRRKDHWLTYSRAMTSRLFRCHRMLGPWRMNGVYKGTKSYTVRSRSGAVPCHLV